MLLKVISALARSLNWNVYQGQPQGFSHYLIFRETAPGNLNLALIDSVASTQTWYYDNTLTALIDTSRAYMIGYRITTPCVSSRASSQICQSNVTSILLPVLDGLNDLTESNFDFNIFPNPNNGIFKIVLSGQQMVKQWQVSAFTLLGEQVYARNFGDTKNIEMDFRNLSSGVYFIGLSDGVSTIQKRVVLTK
jgi:hypothetical protein